MIFGICNQASKTIENGGKIWMNVGKEFGQGGARDAKQGGARDAKDEHRDLRKYSKECEAHQFDWNEHKHHHHHDVYPSPSPSRPSSSA